MIRKLRFPIKLKINILIIFLLLSAISFYVYFAQDLFKKDKSAYIYENALTTTESMKNQVENYLDTNLDHLVLLSTLFNNNSRENLKNIFLKNRQMDMVYFIPNKNPEAIFSLAKENAPKLDINFENYKNREANKVYLEIIESNETAKESYLLIFFVDENNFSLGVFNFTPIHQILRGTNLYETFIVKENGDLFLHQDINIKDLKNKDYLQTILNLNIDRGVKEISGKANKLISFYDLKKYNLFIMAEIEEEKAYAAAKYLLKKSFSFAILIISIAIILGLLFSRSLTKHVENLTNFTNRISEGEFGVESKIKTHDEIGVLSDSFNLMSKAIKNLLEEMKEKARMENEFEVAKLVQSSFFPKSHIRKDNLSLSAYYTPASECGGDWWGHLEFSGKHIVFIADATGHGVPAALLTATVNCCKSNLEAFAKIKPEVLELPSNILHLMNHAVASVGNNIMLTAFVAIIDPVNETLTYANASHNPPLIFSPPPLKDTPYTKENFIPLLEAIGPRLGHNIDSNYSENTISFKGNDTLILFTDGVLEEKNSEGKEYGQRRFIKSILSHIDEPLKSLSENVVKEAFNFYGKRNLSDDFTLLFVRQKEAPISIGLFLDDGEESVKIANELTSIGCKILNSRNEDDLKLYDLIISSENKFLELRDKLSIFAEKMVLISNKPDEENIINYLATAPIFHLIGGNTPNLGSEIKSLIQKRFFDDIFGIEHYLSAGSSIVKYDLYNSQEINDVLDKVVSSFDFSHFFDSPAEYLKVMGNELISNALYNAPKSREGLFLFGNRDRKLGAHSGQKVTFKMGVDQNLIILSVTDHYGSMNRDLLIDNLTRSFRDKTPENKQGGAGLGLYLTFSYSNQFILHSSPDKKTEIICIIEHNKRYKRYKERITSFHYFKEV